MAARLDLHAGTQNGPVVGFVSANDEDEERLAALFENLAGRSALAATGHGSGHVTAAQLGAVAQELRELTGEVDGDLETQWVGALLATVRAVEAQGATLAWHLRYDVGGSVDDGPDEFPTAASGPPS